MTDRALGRRSPKRAPRLRFADFWTGAIPAHPDAADHMVAVKEWGLWGNDRYSDCGPVSYGNLRKLITAGLTGTVEDITQDDVLALYKRVNPAFDPNEPGGPGDAGVDMQTMLEQALQHGFGPEGEKPVAFAAVDHTRLDELWAAVAIFGGVLLGVNLEAAQQEQTGKGLWDYKRSGTWGGHAVMCGRYSDVSGTVGDRSGVVTWGQVVDFTDAFARNQLDEVWVVVFPEHLGTAQFQTGVDRAALASAYKALTGRELPLPPAPAPTPPTPAPDWIDRIEAVFAEIVAEIRNAFKSR